MNLRLIAVFMLLAASGCRKEDSLGTPAPSTVERKTVDRGTAGTTRSHGLRATLDSLSRGGLRTKEEAGQLESSIRSLGDSDLLQLLEEIGKIRNLPQNRMAFAWAIAELARRDPESVMKWFPPEEISRDEAGYTTAMGVLAGSRPDVLQAWLTNDLKKASKGVQASWLDMGLQCLSHHDPALAFQFWKTLEPGRLDNQASIFAIFGSYGKKSPSEALAAAESSFKGPDLDYARYNIAAGAEDPITRIEIASGITDPFRRGMTIAGGLSELMISDRPAALKKLAELDSKDLQATLQVNAEYPDSLVQKLGKADPDTLVRLLDAVVASSSTESLFRAAVGSLTAESPDKALALVESMPDGKMKTEMLGSQFRAMSLKDPSAALDQASRLATGNSRNRAYESIGQTVGARGLEETLMVAASLAPGDKKAFMGSALLSINADDPKKAAEVLANGNVELGDSSRNDLLEMVGGSLGRADVSYATNWLAKLPESQQPRAMKGIAAEMAQSDILGLSSMLSSIPRDRNWETGVKVLIENIRGADPERAAEWQQLLTEAGYK